MKEQSSNSSGSVASIIVSFFGLFILIFSITYPYSERPSKITAVEKAKIIYHYDDYFVSKTDNSIHILKNDKTKNFIAFPIAGNDLDNQCLFNTCQYRYQLIYVENAKCVISGTAETWMSEEIGNNAFIVSSVNVQVNNDNKYMELWASHSSCEDARHLNTLFYPVFATTDSSFAFMTTKQETYSNVLIREKEGKTELFLSQETNEGNLYRFNEDISKKNQCVFSLAIMRQSTFQQKDGLIFFPSKEIDYRDRLIICPTERINYDCNSVQFEIIRD